MPSIHPDYEYDIFISYRQKDNNLDGWVTEFVETLTNEISATFKENISIYFDENPHDGLLETHDVDLSLTEKVKAIIFIPIISQTYCDPNCFAWQKEFIAFRDFAQDDKLGLDIKLNNGNVAKRILPVKIHEIDHADTALYEKEVGGVMRAIEFIYKSPGVNRSLRSVEEHPEDNFNKTIYRDQINKVANGIKEIITSVKYPSAEIGDNNPAHLPEAKATANKKYTLPLIITLLLIVFLLITFKPWQSIISSESIRLEDKSIAVLPFTDLSPNQDKAYLSEGIAAEIINSLEMIDGLKVIGQRSSFSYKDKNTDLITIGKELGVRYLLEGSIQQEGSIIRVGASLIDSKDGSSFWTYNKDKRFTSVHAIQDVIAGDISEMFNDTRNKPRIIEVSPEVQDLYYHAKYYSDGGRYDNKENMLKAMTLYKKAISLDSGFSKAYSGLSFLYAMSGYFRFDYIDSPWENAKMYANKSIDLDINNAEGYFVLGYEARTNDWNWEAARKLYQKSLALNPNSSLTNFNYGLFLACVNEADSGLYYAKKAYKIDPLDKDLQRMVFRLFDFSRNYEEGLNFLNSVSTETENIDWRMIFLRKNELYDQYIDLSKTLYAGILDGFKPPPFEVYEKSGFDAFQEAWYNQDGRDPLQDRFSYESMEESFNFCKEQIDNKEGYMVYLLVDPDFDPLRNDPRFDDLLKRMDLYKYKQD